MCGITGIFSFNLVGKFNKIHIHAATQSLSSRGPDHQDIYADEWVALGHRRLSIIDTSSVGHQPMWDDTDRYCIVFNGEIFNYKELKKELTDKGITFRSESDTEVLLKLYILEKEKAVEKLNGFFAFCIYDKIDQSFFVARDRYGIKPLLYVFDENKFIFASEMKTILHYGVEKDIDYNTLTQYLELNYCIAPDTIFKKVKKLLPGHYLIIRQKQIQDIPYYEIPHGSTQPIDYENAKIKLRSLLDEAVQRRLVADVPLGAFLSGGIDSSVIVGLASAHQKHLHTFSIGFRDEKFFDETHYANLVSKHFQTEHTVFSLTNQQLFEHVHDILNYIDEPFADSSAINVFILSKETRKHATVALSGDGADELFSGYNKHAAFYKTLHPGFKEKLATALSPLLRMMPQSRNNPLSNFIRQAVRFSDGNRLSPAERYWQWAGFAKKEYVIDLLSPESRQQLDEQLYQQRKENVLKWIPANFSMNDILMTDLKLVLPNDMLTKVDLMSMANSLEVRVPFLDVNVVNFVSQLPDDYKINQSIRKRILQDTFRDLLPATLYNRPKKGFEVPLLKWLRHDMKAIIDNDLLSEKLITEQNIFNYKSIHSLKQKLYSKNPGDVHARIWALVVFQWWWKKYGE